MIIDGGNSYFKDDVRRARAAAPSAASTTSTSARRGGVWGLERGYCLMIGGDAEVVERLDPIFTALAPGRRRHRAHARPRAAATGHRRAAATSTAARSAPGHFVKMIHNGIEYGVMQAYAEGFDIMRNARSEQARRRTQRFDLDLADDRRALAPRQRRQLVAARPDRHRARRGSASSTVTPASCRTPARAAGRSMAAIEEAVPADVLTAALYVRFRSRQEHTFAEKVLSAMRLSSAGTSRRRRNNSFIRRIRRCRLASSISRPTTASTSPSWRARSRSAASNSLFVPEHTHIPASRKSPFPGGGELPKRYSHTHDPFVALVLRGRGHEEAEARHRHCLVPQHDPIVTAKAIASLDQLSGGRFIFGIGAGWNEEEMDNHGASYATRFKQMGDYVMAMKALWTKEEAAFHGEFVNFDPIWSIPSLAEAASADPAGRRDRPHLAPRRRLLRRLVPAPARRLRARERSTACSMAAERAAIPRRCRSPCSARRPTRRRWRLREAGIDGALLEIPDVSRDDILR